MKSFTSHSLEETKKIAQDWLMSISNTYADKDEALVVGLSGHLGAGKTAFTKIVAQLLGVTEVVTSPTFVIMKMYEIKSQIQNTNFQIPWKRLIHIDAYRLERREELTALNWEELVADNNNLILIEWSENVGLKDFLEQTHLQFLAEGVEYQIEY